MRRVIVRSDCDDDTSIAYERQIEVRASLHSFGQKDNAIDHCKLGCIQKWSDARQFA
jgi:hypothetical protein